MISYDFELFHRLFIYDHETGALTRRITVGSQIRGSQPGRLDRDGYIKIGVYGRYFLAHRIAWLLYFGEWPESMLDHIDGNPQNNAINNLRLADHSLNGKNRRLSINNTSGCCGVVWSSRSGKWQAQIKSNGVSHYIGVFDNIFDAAAARKSAENSHGFSDRHGASKEPIHDNQ